MPAALAVRRATRLPPPTRSPVIFWLRRRPGVQRTADLPLIRFGVWGWLFFDLRRDPDTDRIRVKITGTDRRRYLEQTVFATEDQAVAWCEAKARVAAADAAACSRGV